MQKVYFFVLLLISCCWSLQAQIAYQGFEQNAADTWGTTFSTPPCTNGADRWDFSTALNAIVPSAGTQFWGVQDLNGNCGGASETITFADFPLGGATGVTIAFDYDIVGFDNGDDVFYTVVLDGVQQPQVQLVNGGGGFTTGGYLTETINIPNGTTTVGLILEVSQNGGSDFAGFDNFILDGSAGCAHSANSFTPLEGSVGTDVTIVGTGFTATSTVTFNGVAATNVTFVDATTLIATVPANGGGSVAVTEAGCTIAVGTPFTLLEQQGACGATFSDLIISEVYDNNGGSLGYIELFNGTAATIDLTNYRIDRYATIASVTSTHSYDFPAAGVGSSIAPGQVLVARVSNGVGSGIEDFVFPTSTAGFNADDRLELIFVPTLTLVDDFHDATVGAVGFVYRRNTTISGPNPTFTASEWTTGTSGDESDLGTYNFVAASAATITAQPTDFSGCALSLSVAATPSTGGATLTYEWFYNENDGVATGWTTLDGATFAGATVTGATTTTVSITGNLSALDNFQFYCVVTENGSCGVVSEAVQYDLDAERFFRSRASGNWTDINTWEMATSAAGPWSPTCVFPVFDNSDYIHVITGHTVNVDQDIIVDEVVVETGGTLSIQSTRRLEFNNGTGIDLLVEGTLVDNGSGAGNGINFSNAGATWQLDANGEIIKTASSSVAQYRDNYEGGIATIPATATWRFRHDGTSGAVAVLTVNMFYPNLFMESTNGNHSFSGAAEVFQGASGFMTVKGDFHIASTGTGSVDVFNANTNATPLIVMGDLILGGNGAAGTSKFENNGLATIGTGIEVRGDIVINTNGQLDFSDGVGGSADGVCRLFGNWNDFSTANGFVQGESRVLFVGTTNQQVNKAGGLTEGFFNVTVNKPSGILQNNAAIMQIENDMTFTNGIVQTTATTPVSFDATATATTASNASHIDGPVIKETINGSVTNFTYPTGDNGIYGAIGIETRFHTGVSFRAEYFNTGYGSYNVNTAELDHVSSLEYWLLDEEVGTGENLRVTLHWGPHSDVVTTNSIRVAHYFTQAPSTVNQWEREGNTPVITGTPLNGTVTSDFVTSFSPFTLADIVTQRSLPLDLLSFEANKVGNTTQLDWTVANEKAGDRYCIQRSADGYQFETLYCVDATNDQATASYQYTDETPLSGYNYYRIHQIDYAGVSDYSFVRVVYFEEDKGMVQAYPNPANEQLIIKVSTPDHNFQSVQLVDALGRIVLTAPLQTGMQQQVLDVSSLPAGTYSMGLVHVNGAVQYKKLVIQH